MSKKKKKYYYNEKNNYLKNKVDNDKSKKILDGVDLISKEENSLNEEKMQDVKLLSEEEKSKEEEQENLNTNLPKNKTVNDHIQSFVSILFTIIIFVALILLIFVLYNNYLKEDKNLECDTATVCQDYIKKDYGLKEEDVLNFIKDSRSFLYNIYQIDTNNLKNNDLIQFATYYIWGLEGDYILCEEGEENCLVSKKEISFTDLKTAFKKYLNIDNLNITFNSNFQENDRVRLFLRDDTVVLTFSEFSYQTLKHDVVDVRIDSDEVTVIFALSRRFDETNYSYTGSKKMILKYVDNRFVIQEITTNLLSS